MKSSYLTNLILVIVIAGLFWFGLQDSNTTDAKIALSDIKADSINEILIKRADRAEIQLSKKTAGWQLTQPISADANQTRVDLLLSLLGSTIHNQLSHPSDDMLKQLGLKPVTLSLQLNEQLFVFGDVEPIEKRRYVLLKNTVYLIDDLMTPLLNASASSFINNRLFAATDKITKLQLPLLKDSELAVSSDITISNLNGNLQSSSTTYSEMQLNTVITNWQQATAMQVTTQSTDRPNQNNDQVVLLWLNDDAEPTKFVVRKDQRSLYLTNTDTKLNYHFPIALAQQLFLPLTESD